MSLRNRSVLPIIALLSLSFLVGCGGSGSTPSTPPPTGGFSNTNLSGTYVFSTSGQDASGLGFFIAIAGTFTANGSGGITGGTISANDPVGGVLSGQAVTGGTYNVGVDGRPASSSGLLTLQTAAGNFTFDFVLTSSEHGLITLYDPNNGTGSGTLDLQTTVTQASIDSQSYAFNVNGIGSANTSTGAETSYSSVGGFTLDANGSIGVTTSGVQDVNSNGISVCGPNGCTINSGSISLASVPGIATIATNAGTFNFDVYPVDPSHLKLIEVDAFPVLAGDLFTQSSSIPTGNNVFTVAGFDSAVPGPFTAAGLIDTDGSGNIKTDSVEDINDAGVSSEVGSVAGNATISGTYTALSSGRSVMTLSGFVNGSNSGGQFAAYPSSGGLQLLEIDNAGVTGGVAYAQGASPTLATNQGYGMNLSGTNSVEEDDIAEFTYNNGTFSSGHIDFNDDGSTNFDLNFSSTYAADSTVSGRAVVTPGANGLNLVSYVIGNSTGPAAVFVETDNNQVGLGALVTQTASAKSNAAMQNLTVLRAVAGSKNALQRKKK